MQKKIVLVGAGGVVGALGLTPEEMHQNMMAGRTGFQEIPAAYKDLGITCRAHAPLPAAYAEALSVTLPKGMNEQVRLATVASIRALQAAGIMDESGAIPPVFTGERFAISIGAGGAPITTIEEYLAVAAELEQATAEDDPEVRHKKQVRTKKKMIRAVQESMTSAPSAGVGVRLPFLGERVSVGSACATGLHNIINLVRQILLDEIDAGLAGGVEDTCVRTIEFFDAPGALATSQTRDLQDISATFSQDRDGFVPASGAAVVCVASEAFAKQHGLPIVAYITGYASNSNEGKSMTDPTIEGEERLFRAVLKRSGLMPAMVDLISAHGTATPKGDLVEGTAMHTVFAERRPIVTSVKRQHGHMLGGSGGLSVVLTVQQMLRQEVPGMRLTTPDPAFSSLELAVDTVSTRITNALVVSFGFGGTNAAVALQRA